MSLEPSQRSVSHAFKILLIILDTRNEALGILTGDNEVVLQMWLLVNYIISFANACWVSFKADINGQQTYCKTLNYGKKKLSSDLLWCNIGMYTSSSTQY